MEAKWRHRFTKSKSTKEKPKHVPFRISEAHKSSMALRCVVCHSVASIAHFFFHIREAAAQNAASESVSTTQEVVNVSTNSVDPDSHPHSPASIQGDEDNFGYEIPTVEAPGPIPEYYPSDEEDALEYMPGSELPEELSTDDEFEAPAAVYPPVYEDLGAESGHRDDAPAFVDKVTTCSGRKHRVYNTQAACDCSEPVTEAQRADSESAIRCTKMGCETEWVSNSFSRCSLN
jgi:hypothetical protein